MAGIGFQLRRLTAGDTLSGVTRAYGYAGIISSGPWIISVLSMVLLSWLLGPLLPERKDLDFFSASISYVYAFSLILVGPLQFVVTRFAADKFSEKKGDALFPSYLSAMTLTALLAAILGGSFFMLKVTGPMLHRLSATALMIYVSCIFISSNYLTALRNYRVVAWSFAGGYVASVLLAWVLAKYGGPGAAMAGFAAGHFFLLILLIRALHREFGSSVAPSWEVAKYFWRFPSLALVGLFYNLGIWADKLMFWAFSKQHVEINGLYASPEYDVAICLSLLAIVPGMAVFFLKLETDFAEQYEAFFSAIENRRPLKSIVAAREGIVRTLREGFMQLFKVQGLVTILLVAFAEKLGLALGIGSVKVGIFQVTLFGTFLLIGFLSLLTVLFYVDDRKGALLCTASFALANAGLSLPTIKSNEAWFGFGFVIAAGLGMALAAWRVNSRVASLESAIFRAQG